MSQKTPWTPRLKQYKYVSYKTINPNVANINKFSIFIIKEFWQSVIPTVPLAKHPLAYQWSCHFLQETLWGHLIWNIWIQSLSFRPRLVWLFLTGPCILRQAHPKLDRLPGRVRTMVPSNPQAREVLSPKLPDQRYCLKH